MSAYLRVNVGSVVAFMSVLSARAAELGSTTRDQRVALYAQPQLTAAVLSALETGSRVPTAEEREALHTAGDALGWGISDALLAALPASE